MRYTQMIPSNHHSKLLLFIIILIISAFFGVFIFLRTINVVEINDTVISYKAAITNEQKSVGLSNTKVLNENEGMLFFFNQETPSFWMKDMSFPIDIIWISNGVVIQIDHDVQPPVKPDETLETYSPPSPIDYVLEVNSGFSEAKDIEVGNKVRVN